MEISSKDFPAWYVVYMYLGAGTKKVNGKKINDALRRQIRGDAKKMKNQVLLLLTHKV